MDRRLLKSLDFLIELVYPSQCGLCGALGEPAICAGCWTAFPPSEGSVKMREDGPLGTVYSVYGYTEGAAWAVQRLKFARVTALAEPLAKVMAEELERLGPDGWDAIVPVPIHWTRRAWRGFNQSELLCEAMPRGMVKPWLTARVRATKPQSKLRGAERMRNLDGAFAAKRGRAEGRVLLVDDVFTTGSTLLECARALRAAGAEHVDALTLCGRLGQSLDDGGLSVLDDVL